VFRGSLAGCVEQLEAAHEISTSHPGIRSAMLGYDLGPSIIGFLGLAKAFQGLGSEANTLLERGLEAARGSDAPTRALVLSWAAMGATLMRERERGLARGMRAFEICEPINARNIRGLAMIGLGWAQLANEQWSDAAQLLRRVWTETTELQRTFAYCGRAVLESEGPEAGLARAEEQSACTEALGARLFECTARLDLADVLVRLPEPPRDRVERELARASELIDDTGARALRPRIHEVRALLDPDARERELDEAQRLYAEMFSPT
jgi:hypothetical protein